AYPINQEKVTQLCNSIKETTFWDNILARPTSIKGKFEIAYGHHRLPAIKKELGEDAIVDIPVRELSDENMLKIMANENMREWSTDWRIIVETVRAAKKFLDGHPGVVKKLGFQRSARIKEGTGARTIAKFLGKNWPEYSVSEALGIMKDKEVSL
ncbi:unnamed protein product, partial [marine sediment metagenome]